MVSTSEDEPLRRLRRRESRPLSNFNDFKVVIPKFKGKLDLDEFLGWMKIVERVFDLKDVPEERKVKHVALKLRKYASLVDQLMCQIS